jgi:hypothetical protein
MSCIVLDILGLPVRVLQAWNMSSRRAEQYNPAHLPLSKSHANTCVDKTYLNPTRTLAARESR